ncbi:MAG: hypothetical protein ACXVBJ_09990 [Flavisolibacter sp.]
MKRTLTALLCIAIGISLRAQTYKINWGDELKLKKGTTDIDVIAADNTGLYFTEQRVKLKSYFVIGATYGTATKLFKLDKNFNEVFDKDYSKELKGYDFHSFQMLDNDLFLFATDYSKKEKTFKVYAAKVDRTNGNLVGDFNEFGSFQLESKRDDYDMKVTSIHNGKSFLAVTNISGKEKVSLGISVLDKNLVKKQNTVIDIPIDPGSYSLQDVQLTSGNKIVVLGKEFEESQVGKKKKKKMVFKQYVMSIFNDKGRREKDINLSSGDKFVIGGKLIESGSNEMLLAGFYSNTSKKDELNGFFINKVDPEKGELKLSSYKEINSSMLGKSFEDPSDEDDDIRESKKDKQKAKEDDDADEFPNSFLIRSVDINPLDNSIVITSEVSKYSYYTYTSSQYYSTSRSWTYTTNYVHQFTNRDILVINADKDGNIRWMNDIPKSQQEEIRTSNTAYNGGISFASDFSSYFAEAGGMPFYSSYKSLLVNNSLVILLNDHSSNTMIAGYGDKVKTAYNFRKKSNAYGISIDLATGKMTKKFIAENSNDVVLMPRHGMVVGSDVIIPSWRMHAMAKTDLKFAKVTVK